MQEGKEWWRGQERGGVCVCGDVGSVRVRGDLMGWGGLVSGLRCRSVVCLADFSAFLVCPVTREWFSVFSSDPLIFEVNEGRDSQ